MNFQLFKNAVAKQFEMMSKHDLFRTSVTKDNLWDTYLGSYPEGSNPIYRERTVHDCNCCKQFIRAVGDVVAVIDGELVSIWDISITEPAYQAVADALSAVVKSQPIENKFYHYDRTAGTDKNFELFQEKTIQWDHFFVNIPTRFVLDSSVITSKLGKYRSTYDVFKRALKEIDRDAIDTVLELIAQNSLYKGEEFKSSVVSFRALQVEFDNLDTELSKEMFVWSKLESLKDFGAVTGIRNTVIGTLIIDLSEGKELDHAVASYDTKTAPTNYKRPTALISKSMIESAQKTIVELGLQSALSRRYAVLSDITINNILFANRDAKAKLDGNIFDQLASEIPVNVKNLDKVEEITVDKFLSDVLPSSTSIEVMVENRHSSNLVSLVAPTDPTAKELFKWSNKFSWSYNGEVTDSIKERVKAAGGSIEGDLLCRLAWDYEDDLDFHMYEPDDSHIFFRNRRSLSGGHLDVDANGMDGIRKDPVENIYYKSKAYMKEGIYTLCVNNWTRRSDGRDFTVEIEFDGKTHSFTYEGVLRAGATIEVAKINYSKKDGFTVVSGNLTSKSASKQVWNINTEQFHKVNVMMLSPNHWDDNQVGNKHYFFMVDGCINPDKTRGFYNEFLNGELDKHRKVFEVVGSKMKTEESNDQLSGLGFSSTQRNSVLVKVTGKFTRTIKVLF